MDDGEDDELVLEDESDDEDTKDSNRQLTQVAATTVSSSGEPLGHSQLASAPVSSQRLPYRHRRRALSSDDEDNDDGHGATSLDTASSTVGAEASAVRPGHRLGGECPGLLDNHRVNDEAIRERRLRALGYAQNETEALVAVDAATDNGHDCVQEDPTALAQAAAQSHIAVWIEESKDVDPRSLSEFLNGRTLRCAVSPCCMHDVLLLQLCELIVLARQGGTRRLHGHGHRYAATWTEGHARCHQARQLDRTRRLRAAFCNPDFAGADCGLQCWS
eukprot:COSAG02_NODE_224_length_28285_cov_39.533066_9_plen_275_part_00